MSAPRSAQAIQRDIAFLERRLKGEPDQLAKALAPLHQEWSQLMGQLSLFDSSASADATQTPPPGAQTPATPGRAYPAPRSRSRKS